MRARLTLAAIVALAAAVALVVRAHGGGTYTVRAEFADASGLRGHSEVKVGGVQVGTVSSMAVSSRNTALVTMKLSNVSVGPDAHAFIRPVNLLGEKYVDLEPGEEHPTLSSGSLIPLARTGTPVELDQLLDTLDASTRLRLEVLIDSSGQALAGRGADLGATLAALPPALDQAQQLIGAFAQDNQALGQAVQRSDRVIGAMAGQRRALGALVSTTSSVLSTIAGRDSQLSQTLVEAPGAVDQLRATLAQLRQTAGALLPATSGLRASAPGMSATLQALPAFTAAAQPTLRQAQRTAPALTRLGVEATPVVIRLEPVSVRLEQFASAFGPVSETFDTGIGNLLGFLEGWARAIQLGDGASHMFRNQLILSPEIVQRLLAGYLRSGAARPHEPGRHPSASSAPSPPAGAGPAAPAVTRRLSLPSTKLAAPVARTVQQVQKLVGQLSGAGPALPTQSSELHQLLRYLTQS